MALWCYLLGNWSISGMGVNPNLTGADKQAAQRVLSADKDIYARGMEWTSIVSPKLTATPDQAMAYAATVNSEEVYQQVFTIESETWAITPVLLSLDESAPDGAKITDMDGHEISQVMMGTNRTEDTGYTAKVKVVYPKSSIEGETGTFQLMMSTDVKDYRANWWIERHSNHW